MTTNEQLNIEVEGLRFHIGHRIQLRAKGQTTDTRYQWQVVSAPPELDLTGAQHNFLDATARETVFETTGLPPGHYTLAVTRTPVNANHSDPANVSELQLHLDRAPLESIQDSIAQVANTGIAVNLQTPTPTNDQALWAKMRACFERRSFTQYRNFIDRVLCEREPPQVDCGRLEVSAHDCCYKHGVRGYELLKAATEVFLLCHACCEGANTDDSFSSFDPQAEQARLGYHANPERMRGMLTDYLQSSATPGTLPYLGQVIANFSGADFTFENFPFCSTSIRSNPCMFELLWCYWMEEAGLIQALNAISLRFQNIRTREKGADPLANFGPDPLRPLSNLLWGFVQDPNRLSVARRSHEYEHQYGLPLFGKAAGNRPVAERRSKFLESFHNLLHRASIYYKDAQNLMVRPDTFALLEAIKAVHLSLAQGAVSQWGEMATSSRGEIMLQQWLLAQPPMGGFLQTRAMVPYDEAWMGPLDAMKRLMSWNEVSVIHFYKLATFGESILLSVRFGHWNSVTASAEQAENWARYWKTEIQGYIESYLHVTGADLSAHARSVERVDATLPGLLMAQRRRSQGQGMSTPSPSQIAK